MKLEISHDSLAKHIYEKASAEDKNRKKIADFIHSRYKFFLDSKSLLKSDDLHYIEPYLDEIELPSEELAFVKKSQDVEKRQRVVIVAGILAVVLLLSALTGWALWGWNAAKAHEMELEEQATNLKEEKNEKQALIIELRKAKRDLEEKETKNKALADELAAKNDLTFNLDSLSEDQKKAIIITLVGSQQELAAEKVKLQEMYERIIEREVHKVEDEKDKEKAEEIKKAKDEEAQRIRQLLEEIHKQQINQKENELKNAKSVALSAKALRAFERNELRSAFQLASAAYELDKKNKEAIEILRKIAKKKSDVFDQKYGPSLSDPEQIIKRFRKTYGQQSSSIIQQRYFRQQR